MFIKFKNKRASFDNGNLLVGYNQATLPEDPVVIDPPVIEPLGFPIDEFNDIEAVYNALYPDDILILILRHGHRNGSINGEVLTTLGEAQCRLVGSKLKFNDDFPQNESIYISSDSETERTRKTCYYIMKERGDTNYTNYDDIFNDYKYNPVTEGLLSLPNKDYNVLRDKDFQDLQGYTATTGNGWGKMSNYSFELHQTADAGTLLARKEEKEELSYLILDKLIAVSNKKVNIYATHDYKLTPLLSTFTGIVYDFQDQKPGFDISEGVTRNGKWINYLSGLACVIHIDGVREYIPVRGLDEGSEGYMYGYTDQNNNLPPTYTGPSGNFEWTRFLP